MSRTNHHRDQRDNKCSSDFGSKYKVNKYYGGGSGRVPKDAAHRQMRCEGKSLEQDAVVSLREGDFLYEAEDVDGIDGSGICERCLEDTWLGDCYNSCCSDSHSYGYMDDTCKVCGNNEFIDCKC